MFRILVVERDGEGTQRHVEPPMHEGVTFPCAQSAAEELFLHYGHGMVTTLTGEHVVSVP